MGKKNKTGNTGTSPKKTPGTGALASTTTPSNAGVKKPSAKKQAGSKTGAHSTSVAAASSTTTGAPAPAKRKKIDNFGQHLEDELQNRPVTQATVNVTANGVAHPVEMLDIFDDLHQQIVEISKQDHPLRPVIETSSNKDRLYRADDHELGLEWTLSDKPLNDFWQMAMAFRKERTIGMIDIKSGNTTIATARYNQYGNTARDPFHDDVMVYKAPTDDTSAQSDSDKGVSYAMGILKFDEIITKVNTKLPKSAPKISEKNVASYLLDFYKDGTIPDSIKNDALLLRNFGYLATLMALPETRRDVGVFPYGLMTLHSIKNGKMKVIEAFYTPNEKPKNVVYQSVDKGFKDIAKKIQNHTGRSVTLTEKEVVELLISFMDNRQKTKKDRKDDKEAIDAAYQYKGWVEDFEILADWTASDSNIVLREIQKNNMTVAEAFSEYNPRYPPAIGGSKASLNVLEQGAKNLFGIAKKDDWNSTNAKPEEIVNMIAGYNQIVQDFIADNPDVLTSTKTAANPGEAMKLLTQNILTKLGIGPDITDPNTPQRLIQRAGNTALGGIATSISPNTFLNPPNLGTLPPPTPPVVNPNFMQPGGLLPAFGRVTERNALFASVAEKRGDRTTREYAREQFESQERTGRLKTRGIERRAVRSKSPTKKRTKLEEEVQEAVFENRSKRTKMEEDGNTAITQYLEAAANEALEQERQQAQALQFHNNMANTLLGSSFTITGTPQPLPTWFHQEQALGEFEQLARQFVGFLATHNFNGKAEDAKKLFFSDDVVKQLFNRHQAHWTNANDLQAAVEKRLTPYLSRLPQ